MRSIDTSAARMDALASAIRELVPTLVSIQRRHGLKVAQLALQTALDACQHEAERQPKPALALMPRHAD